MSKKDTILLKLGENLSKKSKLKFKSNVEFADVSNLTETSIRRILQGKQNVSLKTLKNICEALEIKISDLLKELGY